MNSEKKDKRVLGVYYRQIVEKRNEGINIRYGYGNRSKKKRLILNQEIKIKK